MSEPRGAYRARISDDANFFAQGRVRLDIWRQMPASTQLLLEDGTWLEIAEGIAIPENAGLRLPAAVVEALAEAVTKFQGGAGHPATEVRVLREWLAHEQRRVDAVLDKP